MENEKTKKLMLQIIRFSVVGFAAFVVDYLVMVFSKEILNFSVFSSVACGFVVSIIFNYLISIKWVFDVKEKENVKKNFVLFVIFGIVGLIITEIIMFLGTSILKISYLIVKIFAVAIVMVFNFITRKLFLEY